MRGHCSGRAFGLLMVIVAATVLLASPVVAEGRSYFVSPDGDDGAAGSESRPWRSPAMACQRIGPGDTLVLLSGEYSLTRFQEDILRPPSGRADAWVTVRGAEGARPELVGGDDLYTAIDVSGARYLLIEGIDIRSDWENAARGGLRDGITGVDRPLSDVILRDLRIHHLDEFGINLQDAYNLRIECCEISYCGFGAIGGPTGVAGGWRQVVISDTVMSYGGHYYRGGDGSDRPYDRPDGVGLEPSDGPLTIVDCRAEHNRGDGLDSKISNTTIDRCVVANNSCDGIKLWAGTSRVLNTLVYGRGDGDDMDTPWAAIVLDSETADQQFELIHVTVHDALGGNYLAYVQYDHPDLATKLVIRNSILCGEGPNCPVFVGDGTDLQVSHTLFYLPQCDDVLQHGGVAYGSGTIASLGNGVIYGDPKFVKSGWGDEGDYALRAHSPAIDRANDAWAPPGDLQGTARCGRADIGAYEWWPMGAPCLILPLIMAS